MFAYNWYIINMVYRVFDSCLFRFHLFSNTTIIVAIKMTASNAAPPGSAKTIYDLLPASASELKKQIEIKSEVYFK